MGEEWRNTARTSIRRENTRKYLTEVIIELKCTPEGFIQQQNGWNRRTSPWTRKQSKRKHRAEQQNGEELQEERILRDLIKWMMRIQYQADQHLHYKSPNGEERKGQKNYWRNNLGKGIDIQVQEAQRVPNMRNLKRSTPRHIIIKMVKVKDKERILKSARGKQHIIYKGNARRPSEDFSAET